MALAALQNNPLAHSSDRSDVFAHSSDRADIAVGVHKREAWSFYRGLLIFQYRNSRFIGPAHLSWPGASTVWVQQRDYVAVGIALADARQRAGLTQKQLAKLLRKPQSFVSNYESGQRRIDVLELTRIASALDR
jgi:hypothetical protein